MRHSSRTNSACESSLHSRASAASSEKVTAFFRRFSGSFFPIKASGCHAKVHRTKGGALEMPPLLVEVWREQHPSGHKQMLPMAGREIVENELKKASRRFFRTLSFTCVLEDQFERSMAKERSHRLWLEGMLAIILLNGCLLLDYVLLDDIGWKSIVLRTMFVTPLAIVVNLIVRLNPRRWIREGSVAAGTTMICFINLYVEGNASAPNTTYGLMCVLITVLFADVVMRIRLWYAVTATALMSMGALWHLASSTGLRPSEKIIAGSMLAIGIAITMTASYSLERDERLGYLLHLRGELQAEELAALNSQLLQLSTVDELTGLPNRRAFEERFREFWAEGERSKRPLSAIILDVDQFKSVNDRLGHLYADKVLQRIAALLPQELRGKGDFVARFGGEEFVVLLSDTELEKALLVAERIRGLIHASGSTDGMQRSGEFSLWPTISCGVSMCVPSIGVQKEDLLTGADQALYDAKAGGRNRVSHRIVE